MTPLHPGGIARHDDKGAVALVVARWLHLAATPAFAIMALATHVLDGSGPMALCSGAGSYGLGGMTPMYWLMAAFHLGPWLKLLSRRGSDSFHPAQSS